MQLAIENIRVVVAEGCAGLTRKRVAFGGFLESAFHITAPGTPP